MKNLTKLILSIASSAGLAVHAADQHVYLSAGGKVTVFQIDDGSGELTKEQELDLEVAGPMTASKGKNLIYVNSSDDKQPAIATLRVVGDGTLELVEKASSRMSAGYLSVDKTGSFLAGNNYGLGKVATWRLADGVFKGAILEEVKLEKKAHSAVFSPNNKFLLVPATGPNKVFQLKFNEQMGQLLPSDPPFAEGPQGEDEARQPRHLIFHPRKSIAYTTNEREWPGVGVWAWDAEKGNLETVQNIVTQPVGSEAKITTADLHLTPDAKFLYVSNRDVTNRKATTGEDSIVGFEIDDETGRLKKIGHFPCEHVPRSFDIDETGRFLYVAGQGDDTLGVYRIDEKTGALSRVSQHKVPARPSWVHCMTPGL